MPNDDPSSKRASTPPADGETRLASAAPPEARRADGVAKSAATPSPYATHAERVASREVQEAIAAQLRAKGVPAQDIADEQNEVTCKLLEAVPEPPDLDGCLFLAVKMAGDQAIDYRRKTTRRGRSNVGPTDGADEHAREAASDPHHVRGKVAIVKAALSDGSRRAEMLTMSAQGFSNEEIGKRFKVRSQTVANELTSARNELRATWARRVALGGGLVVVGLVVWSLSRDRDRVARGVPDHPHVTPPPSLTVPSASTTPQPPAPALREIALRACAEQRWKVCADGLDQAKRLDPAGEDLPEVRAARERIAEATKVTP
jgi:hypothetical protein